MPSCRMICKINSYMVCTAVWLLACLTLFQVSLGEEAGTRLLSAQEAVMEGQQWGDFISRKLLQTTFDQTLWNAALAGDGNAAKKAISQGADVEVTPEEPGLTPLIVASEKGHLGVVKALVAAGADVKASRKSDGATALFLAAEFGHADVVIVLLNAGADADVGRKSDNTTPLIVAPITVGFPSELVVRELLDAGANLSLANVDGWTPLYSSAYWGNLETLKIFLLNGADPRAGDAVGNVPLDIVCTCVTHDESFLQCTKGGCDNPRVVEDIRKQLSVFNATMSADGIETDKENQQVGSAECITNPDENPLDCILNTKDR